MTLTYSLVKHEVRSGGVTVTGAVEVLLYDVEVAVVYDAVVHLNPGSPVTANQNTKSESFQAG